MENSAKEKRQYIIINALLISIVLLLGIYIYKVVQSNKQQIKLGYEHGVNVVQQLQDEYINVEKIETTENQDTMIVPIIDSYSGEYNFNVVTNNKYYYNQLDNTAKLIYDTIESNLSNMTSGNYEIKLSSQIADVLYEDYGENKLDTSFQSAWDALMLDRVDTFFIDVTKVNLKMRKTTYGKKVTYALSIAPADSNGYLANGLESKEKVDNILNEIKETRDNIVKSLNGIDYNKIMHAHDWIINNLQYEQNITNNNVYNLYGALIEKSAVCEGYAETLKYILDEAGVQCVLVSGTATNSEGKTERHEWNYVQLYGKWYAIDSTWDDPVVKGTGYVSDSIKHRYFLVGSNEMNKNHFPNGQMTESGQKFVYPTIEIEKYGK
jgi:transglutaminase/protease-like cytokinesis protein 3